MPEDGYDSVSIPTDDYEKAQDYKPEDATWGDCLVAGAERLNDHFDSDTARFGPGRREDTAREIVSEVRNELGVEGDADIAEQLKDELSMTNEPGVEVDVDRLINRIEDLESRLPGKVADELEGRMR